jgi:hypothetical protein
MGGKWGGRGLAPSSLILNTRSYDCWSEIFTRSTARNGTWRVDKRISHCSSGRYLSLRPMPVIWHMLVVYRTWISCYTAVWAYVESLQTIWCVPCIDYEATAETNCQIDSVEEQLKNRKLYCIVFTKFQYQLSAQHFIIINSPTCFGLTYWPSSGSFLWQMQRMFQATISIRIILISRWIR